jgi:hypothetical protein
MFPTIRIDRNRAEAVEPLGTKRKFWFSEKNKRMLFKAEERGTGEDWAEKLACELCRRIGLPHVEYDLAEEYNGDDYLHPGVVCPHCAPSPESLVLGNQLLLAQDPAYPRQAHRKYRVSVYTVEAVLQCLQKLDPPSWRWIAAVPAGIATALDVFVGYVMLDAWIANQDRHHENWAAIVAPEDKKLRLAPTFDHGASLARNLSDTERKNRLESRDKNRQVSHFASRARSAFYGAPEETRTLGTHEAFASFAKAAPVAAKIWKETIRGVTCEEIKAIIEEVPPNRMSEVARRFTLALILENQERIIKLS